jgi:protein DEK
LSKNVDVVFRQGKKVTKGKGESAGADLPSKDELRKTITAMVFFHDLLACQKS